MTKRPLALIATVGFIPLGILCQARAEIYLVTATFNDRWPSRLYRVSTQKTLEQIQEMAPVGEGVESVLDAGSYISLLSPAITPTKLTVIDKASPMHARVQTFDLGAERFLSTPLLHVAVQNHRYYQILPIMAPPSEIATKQISIAPAANPAEDCSPAIYSSVYVDGNPGGPRDPSYILGVARPDGMYVQIGKAQIRIDTQRQKSPLANGTRFVVIAATAQFLVIGLVNWDPKHLEENPKANSYLVHDKEHDLWRSVTVPGNNPTERLFGSWLATTEMSASPDNHSRNNPGHDRERNHATVDLPNVQNEFETYIGADRYIAGRLTLTNLGNGDQITLETGAEDSEILGVLGKNVMYRINDSIFEAPVLEKSLGPAKLIVRDEDVPEVHWIFEAH